MHITTLKAIRNQVFLILIMAARAATIAPQFLEAAENPSTQDINITVLADSLNASLEYDPLIRAGTLSKDGQVARFAVDVPYVLFDWNMIKEVPAPYESEGALIVKKEFARVLQGFFTQKAHAANKFSVKAIVIDPGHGGKDPGAIGEFEKFTLREKEVNLIVAHRLADLLRIRFPERKIILTRSDDTYPSLEDRVEMANEIELGPNDAIIYISIHSNASFNKNTHGFEVWYLNPDYRRTVVDEKTAREKGKDIAPIINSMLEEEFTTESIILAQKVYHRLGTMIGDKSPARGIRAEEWFVVRNANMPSILIEVGFVTNKEEAQLLSQASYLRRIGDALYNGVCDFIEYFEQ
jgi:N-acetylmuramoyl-L-alanine amidase